MTSFRQFEANRRNALKSTGPRTDEGKQRSRCNAIRHGLTAETVISALEDADDYKAFEAAITADYDAESAVERELVLRLASLLWRLRRANTMETGLFTIEAKQQNQVSEIARPDTGTIVHARFGQVDGIPVSRHQTAGGITTSPGSNHMATPEPIDPATTLARCFLGLGNLPNYPLDRLSRYEARLWRQTGQILFALDALRRGIPHDRRRRLGASRWHQN